LVLFCSWWLFDDESVKPSRGDHSGEGPEKEKMTADAEGQQDADGVVEISSESGDTAAVVSPEESGDMESEKDEDDDSRTTK